MRRSIVYILILFSIFSAVVSSAQVIELPEIYRNTGIEKKKIYVRSTQSELYALLRKAFSAHGGYELTSEAKSDFSFIIDPVANDTVKLRILSGNPSQELFAKEVKGFHLNDAALRAADLAVLQTSGQPGIFSSIISFISSRSGKKEAYTAGLLMNNAKQITQDRSNCVRPELSPDGKMLLYTSYYRNGFPDIYKIELSSGRRTTFAAFKGMNTGATFNTDGSRVAMILSGSGNSELYTSNVYGKAISRLTRTRGLESDPSWSPDSKKIVFTSDNLGKPQLFEIYANGSGMKRIPTNISGYCAEPDWNPRFANLIAFTIAQGRGFAIAIYDFNNRKSKTVSRSSSDAIEPCWTRDGRHLIYTERSSKHSRLILLDTLTGSQFPLNDRSWGKVSQADCVYP